MNVRIGIPTVFLPATQPTQSSGSISSTKRRCLCPTKKFSLSTTIPTFDTLPIETNQGTIHVGGVAPGAARVGIVRDNILRFYAPVDSATSRFDTDLELVPGPNKIGGWAEDGAGSPTLARWTHR